MTDVQQSRARRQVMMMFGIAFATMAAAYLLFFSARSGGGWGTTNNGEFVQPPMNAETLGYVVEGQPFTTDGKWWIWMRIDNCADDCMKTLDELRSLHILLNRDARRVERALITQRQPLQLADEKLTLIQPNQALANGIYLVDPLGNLVLRFAPDSPPKPILEDLKKLLKLSQIG